jgi:hypothetical protein
MHGAKIKVTAEAEETVDLQIIKSDKSKFQDIDV